MERLDSSSPYFMTGGNPHDPSKVMTLTSGVDVWSSILPSVIFVKVFDFFN